MSTIQANAILDASGGNTTTVNGVTPTAYNTMGKNRIINGAMEIDQRNAGAAVTTNGAYPVDRFFFNNVSAASASGQQVADAPAGFVKSLKYTVTSADASLDADDRSGILQDIEGYTCADLGFGTSNAKTVTISFWVKSSVTGTFGGALQNNGLNRAYVFSYSISSANTWEYKTVTIPGDTSGTWPTDNTRWGRLYFSVGMGSTRSGSAGSWSSSDSQSFTGATSIMSTLNATFYITGVKLEVGSVATEFDHRLYGEELALCQRYFRKIVDGADTSTFMNFHAWSANECIGALNLGGPMRSTPTMSVSSAGHFVMRSGGTDRTATTFTFAQASKSGFVRVETGSGGGLTTGYGAWLKADNASAYIYADAEL